MKSDFAEVAALLQAAAGARIPAAQLVLYHQGQVELAGAYGWLDPDIRQQPIDDQTRFDLASVTKLFVATTFMRLVEAGQVALDQPVATVLPDFSGLRPIQPYEDPLQSGALITIAAEGGTVDAGTVTFRHLLTHTAGLPAWRPLFRQANRMAAATLARTTFFAYPIGTRVVYSDIGLILLGMAVAELTGLPLAQAVATNVIEPLGLQHTGYLPMGYAVDPANVAPTEFCQWRGRRICGEVHDENAAQLGGVSGHAGLFSTAHDVARFGQSFLTNELLAAQTAAQMGQVQATDGNTRRGLGFLLWSPEPAASSNPFSQAVFGHTGFTGTSLWIDPTRDLVVALLTNEVYNGRANRQIAQLRVDVHQSIVNAISPKT